jgi:glycosyltransferase involved in cell wall biosynthesis
MISVVLATYNEENNLERCLVAVKGFADEIIIVDGASTDNTKTIARQLGARVVGTTNKPNFHINKQLAMDEAKGELVLQLDADEVVDEELASFIVKTHLQVLERSGSDNQAQPVAWYIKRKNLLLGHYFKKTGQYPDPVIRLYVNGFARLPQKDVHEQMVVEGKIEWADGHLIHYANPTFSDYLRKWNTYTSFKAKQLFDEKIRVSFFTALKHIVWLPASTFFLLYIRHKGFMDGVAGFVFSVMSGLHHAMAYLKLWEMYQLKQTSYEHSR